MMVNPISLGNSSEVSFDFFSRPVYGHINDFGPLDFLNTYESITNCSQEQPFLLSF